MSPQCSGLGCLLHSVPQTDTMSDPPDNTIKCNVKRKYGSVTRSLFVAQQGRPLSVTSLSSVQLRRQVSICFPRRGFPYDCVFDHLLIIQVAAFLISADIWCLLTLHCKGRTLSRKPIGGLGFTKALAIPIFCSRFPSLPCFFKEHLKVYVMQSMFISISRTIRMILPIQRDLFKIGFVSL